jgi:peptide/nickel transport system substrate-binding protein
VSSVAAIEAPTPRTLKLRTKTHDPLLLNRLASIPIYRTGGGTNVGTGPYRVRSWTRGSRLEMESFAGYWGGPPAIPRVDFVPLRDEGRVVDALSKGEVDVARAVTNGAAARLASMRGLALVSRGGLWNRFLFVDAKPADGGAKNPLADVRVRRAVSLAIDRAALARRVGGGAMPAGQLPPPGVFGYEPGLEAPARNVAEARRLLAEAGLPYGFETQLLYAPALANAVAAQELERMLAEAGIRVRRQAMPREELIPRWQSGRLPLFLGGWLFDSLDASSVLRDCVATRDPARGTGTFNAGFSSPALDRLIEENASLPGRDARVAQYPVLMKAVLDEMPIVPLFTEGSLFAVSDRVAFAPRLDGRLLAFEVRWKEPR